MLYQLSSTRELFMNTHLVVIINFKTVIIFYIFANVVSPATNTEDKRCISSLRRTKTLFKCYRR